MSNMSMNSEKNAPRIAELRRSSSGSVKVAEAATASDAALMTFPLLLFSDRVLFLGGTRAPPPSIAGGHLENLTSQALAEARHLCMVLAMAEARRRGQPQFAAQAGERCCHVAVFPNFECDAE